MITTNTGAKKIEGTDNWREIFDAHNDSVDAHDTAAQSLAPIVKGKQCAVSVASGKYVLLMGSTITGKADGAYKATKAIPANTDIDGTYLTAATDGFANSLSDQIGNITIKHATETITTNANGWLYFPYHRVVVSATISGEYYHILILNGVSNNQLTSRTKGYLDVNAAGSNVKAFSANTSYSVDYWYFETTL